MKRIKNMTLSEFMKLERESLDIPKSEWMEFCQSLRGWGFKSQLGKEVSKWEIYAQGHKDILKLLNGGYIYYKPYRK